FLKPGIFSSKLSKACLYIMITASNSPATSSEGWRILVPRRICVTSVQFLSKFLYQLSPPRKPVRLNSSVQNSRSASVTHAGSVFGTVQQSRNVSDLSNRKRQRLSGGTSPDAEYSTVRIVLGTSASNSASALPGSWKYSW